MKKYYLSIVIVILLVAGIIWFLQNKPQQAVQSVAEDVKQDIKEQVVLNELSIEAIRQKEYPGSDITIEQELGDKGKFKSYVISYLSEGLRVRALMNIPDSPKPEGGFPVLILNHGYIPPTQYDTINSYKAFSDYYSNQSLIVVKPDYRGHDESEGQPQSAHVSPNYAIDVLNLVASLKKHADVNPKRIGMWGHSMGGSVTLRAILVDKDIKAAMLVAGVVASPQSFYKFWQDHKNTNRVPGYVATTSENLEKEFGSPQTNPDFWNEISPYPYLKDINIPISVHHGTGDVSVPIEFSQEIVDALKKENKNVEYFVYPGADHNLAGSARSIFLQRSNDFFQNNL